MAERSHVKITVADYPRNMILACQLTVQCHTKNTELVHERYIKSCDCNAGGRLNLAICCLVPVMIASVLLGLRSRSFSRGQLVTASAHADRLVNLSDDLSLIVVYSCVSSAY